jgi:hypothetical protein
MSLSAHAGASARNIRSAIACQTKRRGGDEATSTTIENRHSCLILKGEMELQERTEETENQWNGGTGSFTWKVSVERK